MIFSVLHLGNTEIYSDNQYCEQASSETQCLFRLLYSMMIIHKLSSYLYQMRVGEYMEGSKGKREKERQKETD
jgi:hypothetical protein